MFKSILPLCVLLLGTPVGAQVPFFPGAPAGTEAAETTVPDEAVVLQAETAQPISGGYRLNLMAAGPMKFSTRNSSFTLPFQVAVPAPVKLSVGLVTGPGLDTTNSEIVIYVNDAELSREPLSADLNARVEIVVPENLIRPEVNRVRVQVKQASMECEITPEVWAELNPAFTYVDISPEQVDPSWINPGDDGYIDAAYVRNGAEGERSATAIVSASMRLSRHLSRTRIRNAVYATLQDVPEDADLIVTTAPIEEGFSLSDAVIMTVQQIESLTQSNFNTIVDVNGNETKALRDFGVIADGWTESTYVRTITARLPDTFLSMSSGSMTFVMNGSAQHRLSPESTMVVRINDQISASAALPPNWADRDNWTFNVPMHHMRPGLNRIELIMETPGEVCGLSSGGNMALFGDSTITFPSFGEGKRLSIFDMLSGDTVYIVMDTFSDPDITLVANMMSRLARSVDVVPDVELAAPSAWLEERNALVLSTGEEGTRSYESLFGVPQADAMRWRSAIQQRIADLESADTEIENLDTSDWAREAYAYRSVDIPQSQGGVSGLLRRSVSSLVGVTGVDLRGDDAAFLVARRASQGGTHVLLSIADVSQSEHIGEVLGTSGFFLFDGRAAHVELNDEVRPYRDYGLPLVTNMSVSNLRLVFADVVSRQFYIYLLLVVFFGTALAIITSMILPKNEK